MQPNQTYAQYDLDALEVEYRHYETGSDPEIGDPRVLALIAELRASRKMVEDQREALLEVRGDLGRFGTVIVKVRDAMPILKRHFHSQIESAGWLNSTVGAIAVALAEAERGGE